MRREEGRGELENPWFVPSEEDCQRTLENVRFSDRSKKSFKVLVKENWLYCILPLLVVIVGVKGVIGVYSAADEAEARVKARIEYAKQVDTYTVFSQKILREKYVGATKTYRASTPAVKIITFEDGYSEEYISPDAQVATTVQGDIIRYQNVVVDEGVVKRKIVGVEFAKKQ